MGGADWLYAGGLCRAEDNPGIVDRLMSTGAGPASLSCVPFVLRDDFKPVMTARMPRLADARAAHDASSVKTATIVRLDYTKLKSLVPARLDSLVAVIESPWPPAT